MLRLILFRHAKADRPADLADHERPLSLLGHKQARKIGTFIQTQNLTPALAIVSSARRAQETWLEASEAGMIATTQVVEPKIYEARVDDLLDILRNQDSKYTSVMLVGHNPGMDHLTAWLVGSGDDIAIAHWQQGFVVGSLAVMDIPAQSWATLEARRARLSYFETPDTLPDPA